MAYPTDITPREATPSASSRLFSFQRVRSGTSTRFYPGAGTKLHFANRDVDTLEMPGVPNRFLAAGDVVAATYKGTCVFRGDVATIAEARGRGTDATQTVTCVGPWSKMARLVYRQNWFTGGGYSRSSRLVLNQHQDGSTQNLNSELYEIASHGATPCGYTVAQADVAVSTQQLPFDECRDITVADAIRRELRFFPKAVCRFDYSGETPALKIKKKASPTTAAYVAAIPKNRREYVYNAHPITGVDLEIETTGTVDGVEYRQIDHQTAGNTSAGNPDCLYATLQIKGASSNTTRQSFKSVTEDIPQNLNDAAWWKARHPRLANVAANAIAISEGSRTPSNYPRISAATAGELEEAGLHCEVSKFTCKATITTADDKEEEIFLTMNFLTTNATGTTADPKTYTWVAESSSESGETVPSGLAATILAERAGSLLSERMTVRLGDALPQLGDAIVETEGTVFLQSIDVDCASLTADLKFGVPDYLSPEDMAALLSGFRNKRTSSSHTVRKTGKPDDNGSNVEMGAIPPLSSTEFAPGQKAKTIIGPKAANSPSMKFDATGEGGNVDVKSSEIPSGKTIGSHQLTYKNEKGETQTYYGLFDRDIDLSGLQNGKTIADVEVTPSSSETVVKFTYTDGSFTEIHIPHGLPGDPGAPGADGTTPEITSSNHEGVTTIYADGEVIATVRDGHTPVITGQKVGGVTTLYADGVPIAQIADGSGGGSAELPDKNVVTGVSFAISNGKLVATLAKENLKTGATSTSTANVCDVGELDVVVSEDYSTSTHQFTNTRKRIKTIGSPVNANGQTPFTATPLSGE
jgi:uncharacterized Zn-binding protein involved in type VI secretion